MNSTFQDDNGSCSDWSASSGFPGHEDRSSLFPIICVLYLNDLSLEALLSITSILCF